MKADHCRGCMSRELATLHDFGPQPLAGHYPLEPESVRPAKRYPLDLSTCLKCGLLQVLNLPPIEEVFHDDYRYSSSTVPGLVNHFIAYARWLRELLPSGASVFEFGCNDGVLLERLRDLGISCAGIDASDNVAALARAKGLQVTTGFLTPDFVHQAGLVGRFDLVTCSNVFAHIHEIRTTLEAVRLLLKPAGLFVVEVHDAQHLVSEAQFETIYHEHLTYFTEETLRSVLEMNGFEFVSCERTPMHGGALRCLVRKAADGQEVRRQAGKPQIERSDFIEPAIARCREQIQSLYRAHGPLVGYGAAGRSQMFINFTGSASLFERVYDDSPFRQGRYIVGTDIPIMPFNGEPAGCVVVLAWNYASDIARKVRGSASKIVTLLPQLQSW
jgi:SAM-dependent methyltransferase